MMKNPVYRREITLASRTIRVAITLFAFNAIVALVALLDMYLMVEQVKVTSEIQYSAFLELYILVATIEFILLILMIPALTAGSISGERERQTLDLMLTTKMKPWEIIFGKLFSSFQTVFMLLVSSFPILSLVFIYGGIKLYDLIVLLVMFYLAAILMGSLSIWFSTIFKKTMLATVVAYLTSGLLIVGTVGVNLIAYSVQSVRYSEFPISEVYNVGGFIYILLLNPAVTFYGLINGQAGDQSAILKVVNQFGLYKDNFVIQHWVPISGGIQMLLSILFFYLAVRAINPLRGKKGGNN